MKKRKNPIKKFHSDLITDGLVETFINTKFGSTKFKAEISLLVSILVQAVSDAIYYSKFKMGTAERNLSIEAMDWLYAPHVPLKDESTNFINGISFRQICHIINTEPEDILAFVNKYTTRRKDEKR